MKTKTIHPNPIAFRPLKHYPKILDDLAEVAKRKKWSVNQVIGEALEYYLTSTLKSEIPIVVGNGLLDNLTITKHVNSGKPTVTHKKKPGRKDDTYYGKGETPPGLRNRITGKISN